MHDIVPQCKFCRIFVTSYYRAERRYLKAFRVLGEIDTDVPAGGHPRNLLEAGRSAELVIQALNRLRAKLLDEAQLLELRSRLDPSTPATWRTPAAACGG